MTESVIEAAEFTGTADDLVDACRLQHTVALCGRRFFIRMAIGVICVGLFLGFLGFSPWGLYGAFFGLAGAAFYISLMAVLICVRRFFSLPRSARRQFGQRKEFGDRMKMEVRPGEIVMTAKSGFATRPTREFVKWVDNSKIILLYVSDGLFHFVPKRAVSEEFRAALMAELARAGVPRAGFSNS